MVPGDRLREGTTRAGDAQGTPTQSHVSPSILVYQGNDGVHPRSFLGMKAEQDLSQHKVRLNPKTLNPKY